MPEEAKHTQSNPPEDCGHDCSNCHLDCKPDPASLLAPTNPGTKVGKIYAVMSGKGGVGKSSVTALLAQAMAEAGYAVGILDADITGPSIPQAFGLHEHALSRDNVLLPSVSRSGVRIMSLNLLVENETDPVVWRGGLLAGAVRQFWTDVAWGELDYLFVDLPPGTGDVPLTVLQSLAVDGILVVTTPQNLVSMIVTKAVNMAHMMQKPIVGLIENFSGFVCPDCGSTHAIFGESHLREIAEALSLPVLAQLPIDPLVAAAVDAGEIASLPNNPLAAVAKQLSGAAEARP